MRACPVGKTNKQPSRVIKLPPSASNRLARYSLRLLTTITVNIVSLQSSVHAS